MADGIKDSVKCSLGTSKEHLRSLESHVQHILNLAASPFNSHTRIIRSPETIGAPSENRVLTLLRSGMNKCGYVEGMKRSMVNELRQKTPKVVE